MISEKEFLEFLDAEIVKKTAEVESLRKDCERLRYLEKMLRTFQDAQTYLNALEERPEGSPELPLLRSE